MMSRFQNVNTVTQVTIKIKLSHFKLNVSDMIVNLTKFSLPDKLYGLRGIKNSTLRL